MKTPDLSVIVLWDSSDTIAQMLEANKRWFSAYNLEILVVNGGGDCQHLRHVLVNANLTWTGVINLPAPCNHALGVNIGMQFSRSQNLLVLGPNHVLQSDLIGKAIQLLNENVYVIAKRIVAPGLEGYWPRIKEQAGPDTFIKAVVSRKVLKAAFSDGIEVEVESMASNLVENSRSGMSIIAIRKRDLGRIGGYHSNIQWGEWASADVQLRLKKVSRLQCMHEGEVLRLMGTKTSATGNTQSSKDEVMDLNLMCERYGRGDLWGTYSRDVALWRNKAKLEWIRQS
jgi:hypothetical protein